MQLKRATNSEWLEALAATATYEEARIRASMRAIQIAASLPRDVREGQRLGDIVWSASGHWRPLNSESIYLSGVESAAGDLFVHPSLEEDPSTLKALVKLGIECPTPENRFRQIVDEIFLRVDSVLAAYWHDLWSKARLIEPDIAQQIILNHRDWHSLLRLKTVEGLWNRFSDCLIPGPIVPGDGTRDSHIAIDTSYHQPDIDLIKMLGGTDTPYNDFDYPAYDHHSYSSYRRRCINTYRSAIYASPRDNLLVFDESTAKTSVPLRPFEL